MPTVRFEQHCLERHQDQSILDTLLGAGVAVPNSCRAGVCGSCLMRAVEGDLPPQAQAGLKDSWRARGYFLACACKPEGDLTVASVGDEARVPSAIAALERLSGDVMRVRVQRPEGFEYRAGQYVTLIRHDGLARSYSIASLPAESELELHVRRIANGRMSGWLFEGAQPGERVDLLGPSGECFYVAGNLEQPLLLIGAGTGLAPLYGILRDALEQGHRGPIHLFHGATRPEGLYLRDELQRLAMQNTNLDYTASVLAADGEAGVVVGPIDQTVLTRFPKLQGFRAYVCGDPALVQSLKKRLFLGGVALRDIHADPFLPSSD
ncbi:MAG: FAD-binding oxidoreductase [Bryobacteraceae bacterium]